MKIPAIEVVFADEQLLIINKPSGLTVIPERFRSERESVQEMLEKEFGKLWVVHRIDRGTSGLVCFARNEEAHKHISAQFLNHQVGKFYLAIVSGKLSEKKGEINAPIAESQSKRGTMVVHKGGKEALTLYEVQEEFRHASLLRVELKTGRTHQIRVHLAYIGHPLLVDNTYSPNEAFYFSTIKRNYKHTDEVERPTIARITLHAAEVTLTHPTMGESMTFDAPLPKDMETVLKLLRKYD